MVHSQSNDASYAARISRVLQILQRKWTIQIICAMRTGPVRLSELKRAIPAASKKALIASLRSLEQAGMVSRRDLSGAVLHVDYELEKEMHGGVIRLLDQLAECGKVYESTQING